VFSLEYRQRGFREVGGHQPRYLIAVFRRGA
jgi:hypothetical protein